MINRPDEFELIRRYFAPLAAEGAFDLKDDAAIFTPSSGNNLVVTQDAIAQGVHFLSQDPPHTVAKKALRVNLSDIAAKGAKPTSFSMALGLSDDWNEQWIADFATGLKEDCSAFDVVLTGGDTFRSGGGTIVSITALGEVRRVVVLLRRLCAIAGQSEVRHIPTTQAAGA